MIRWWANATVLLSACLEPRVGQGGLEPAVDGFLDLDRQRCRERLRDVRQAVLDPRLDVERVDDLDADPLGQRVDDRRLGR